MFDADLWACANAPSFLADGTVETPDNLPPNALFRPLMVGASHEQCLLTLCEWENSSVAESHNNLPLQMGIERREYNALAYKDSNILKQFAVKILEFHAMRQVGDAHSCGVVGGGFERLSRDSIILHAHPNNCCPKLCINGVRVSGVFEVQFLLRDLLSGTSSTNPIGLPHSLDCRNVSCRSAPAFDEAW